MAHQRAVTNAIKSSLGCCQNAPWYLAVQLNTFPPTRSASLLRLGNRQASWTGPYWILPTHYSRAGANEPGQAAPTNV